MASRSRTSGGHLGVRGLAVAAVAAIATGAVLGAVYNLFTIAGTTDRAVDAPAASPSVDVPTWFWTFLLLVVGLLTLGAIWYGIRSYRWEQEEYKAVKAERKREAEVFESAVDRLREKMALPNLIELNRLMLNNYHGIATEQAESSFRSSRRAMWCGFVWLLACFSAALFIPVSTGVQILVGALAVVGGALSGFLSRTYIRVYERALQQLNQYFNQPLLNSYLLSAERLIGEMSEKTRDHAYEAVLQRLLESGPGSSEVFEPGSKVGRRIGGSAHTRNGQRDAPSVASQQPVEP